MKASKKIAPEKEAKDFGETLEEATPIDKTLEEVKMPESEVGDEYSIVINRDYYGNADPTYLSKKDPHYAYRYVRYEHKNLSIKSSNLLYAKGGWQLCPREHLLKIGIKPREIWSDGLYHVGDLVLARMPKELYDDKMKFKKEQAMEPLLRNKKLLKDGDPTVGGKEMHESMRGIQTAEKLGYK